MNIDIKHITIMIFPNDFEDELYFETDFPDQYDNEDDGNMTLRLTCPSLTGEVYCKKHFPNIPLKIKDLR